MSGISTNSGKSIQYCLGFAALVTEYNKKYENNLQVIKASIDKIKMRATDVSYNHAAAIANNCLGYSKEALKILLNSYLVQIANGSAVRGAEVKSAAKKAVEELETAIGSIIPFDEISKDKFSTGLDEDYNDPHRTTFKEELLVLSDIRVKFVNELGDLTKQFKTESLGEIQTNLGKKLEGLLNDNSNAIKAIIEALIAVDAEFASEFEGQAAAVSQISNLEVASISVEDIQGYDV